MLATNDVNDCDASFGQTQQLRLGIGLVGMSESEQDEAIADAGRTSSVRPLDYESQKPQYVRDGEQAIVTILGFFGGTALGCGASVVLFFIQLALIDSKIAPFLAGDSALLFITIPKLIAGFACLRSRRLRGFGIGILLSIVLMRLAGAICGIGTGQALW